MDILLSKSTWFIIKWVCEVLGVLMNGIYIVLDKIGIPNIGLSIVIFTVLVYLILTPIQIKQQKFSKMTSVMQPELQKIQNKYKGKSDQNSQMKMQEETMAVYQKYGVSPTGSCLPLFLQMGIMFALYQVIYHIPGYISSVKGVFSDAVNAITKISDNGTILQEFVTENSVRLYSSVDYEKASGVTDVLYALKPSQWDKLMDIEAFSGIRDVLLGVKESAGHINSFLGMNIVESPMDIIKSSWNSKSWVLLIIAVLIPVLAWFTQWLNYKLMPQAATQSSNNGQQNSMEQSMKMMNTIMPVMSAFFCLSFSVGIGIYWIIGAVVRCIQQVVINRHMSSIDVDDMIRQNQEKINKKREKKGLPPQKITQQAKMNVRNIENTNKRKDNVKDSTEYYKNTTNLKPGSLASKANMVRQYDEKKK